MLISQSDGVLTQVPFVQRKGMSAGQAPVDLHFVGLVTQSPLSHLNGLVRGHTAVFGIVPKASVGSAPCMCICAAAGCTSSMVSRHNAALHPVLPMTKKIDLM